MPNITSNTAPDRAWLLTPPGPGAIAVIRWSGVEAVRILASHFSQTLQVGRCVHGELRDESGAVIDDPIVVLQDDRTADINLHGGGAIVRAAMSLAQRSGLAIEPPPLDRLIGDDVIEQEVHAALPLARTRFGLATLLAQPRAWKNTIWTDEQIARTLADRSLHWLLYPPTITIIGIPNAGKSTLANRLFGQDRSIVFDQPGTTRDWVGEFADVDGLPVMLIDTPGMRATTDPIEAIAIHRSRENVGAADLVILVLDLTQPERDQVALCSEFRQAFQVINKSDLPPRWQPESLNAHRVVATRGEGVADVRAAIRGHFLGDNGPSSQPLIWTTRQRVFLERMKPVTA